MHESEFEPRPLHLVVKRFFPQFHTSTPMIYREEVSQREEENYGWAIVIWIKRFSELKTVSLGFASHCQLLSAYC